MTGKKVLQHELKTDSKVRELELGNVVTRDSEGRPLSYVYSAEWDFSCERDIAVGAPHKVTFSYIPEELRRVIQHTLKALYDRQPNISVATINKSWKYSLLKLAECLESCDWQKLDQEYAYREFRANLINKKLSAGSIEVIASVINKLHDIGITSRIIHDKSFIKKHCDPGKVVQQAIAIPDDMAQKIYAYAVDIVEEYYPYRHEISQAHMAFWEAKAAYNEKRASKSNFYRDVGLGQFEEIVPIEGFKLSRNEKCIQQIQAACFLLIIGFSGARLAEALRFDKNSYKERKFGDIVVPTLSGTVTKNQEGGTQKKETWVTHPIAKKALDLAYDMSQFAREHYQEKYANQPKVLKQLSCALLTLDLANQKENVVCHDWSERFFDLAKSASAVATTEDVEEFDLLNPSRAGTLVQGGFLPKFSPHDLRRTFAIFLVRNRLGSLMTLKHQYKHLNYFMAKWYINNHEMAQEMDMRMDTELQALIQEANYTVHSINLFKIHQSETLSGAKGLQIMEERKATDVYPSYSELSRHVRNGTASIVDHVTGFCTNPSCERLCRIEYKPCQYLIVTREQALKQANLRERIMVKFTALNTNRFLVTSILTDMALKVKGIEKTLSEHNIEFIPFEPDIAANSIAYMEIEE